MTKPPLSPDLPVTKRHNSGTAGARTDNTRAEFEPTTSSTGVDDTDDEINLLELARVVWMGKYWVVAAIIVAGFIGAYLALQTAPEYRAAGLIQLDVKASSLALPQDMQNLLGPQALSSDAAIQTEMAILQSRMVLGQAVSKLDLQRFAYPLPFPVLGRIPVALHLPDPQIRQFARYQWGDERIEVSEIKVPKDWLNQPMTLAITAPGQYRITLPDGSSQSGKVKEKLDLPGKGFSLTVSSLQGPVGRQFLVGRDSLEATISAVKSAFTVRQAGSTASILNTTYTASSPSDAERVLDAISTAYVDQNIQRSALAAKNSIDFIRKQLPAAQAEVTKAQNALNTYQQSHQSIDVALQTRALLQQVTNLKSQINALDLKEQGISDRFTVNNPAYQAILQQRATLKSQLASAQKAVDQLPETQKEIFNLQSDLGVAQQIYVQLQNREQQLQVVRASTVGSVRVIDKAYATSTNVAPGKTRTLLLALLLGLVVGVGYVLLRHSLRRGIRGTQEIERIGLPVFATVPHVSEVAHLSQRRGQLPILALTKPDNLAVEAVRSLRTSLHFGMLDAKTNTVLLTSPAPKAGKSFLAVNLATVAAQAGQKVCLIDADMRQGYIRRFISQGKPIPGLSEFLAQENTIEEILVRGPVQGLFVITSGRFPPNPSELLMRAEFEELLRALNEHFDLILIDSPPVMAVTDAVIIGHYVGASILVARHTETMIQEIEATRRAFKTAGVRLTGAVMNGYKQSEDKRFAGGYDYRYNYKTQR